MYSKNIVKMPSDVNSTAHCLPRLLSESQIIPIKLNRRLMVKSITISLRMSDLKIDVDVDKIDVDVDVDVDLRKY